MNRFGKSLRLKVITNIAASQGLNVIFVCDKETDGLNKSVEQVTSDRLENLKGKRDFF